MIYAVKLVGYITFSWSLPENHNALPLFFYDDEEFGNFRDFENFETKTDLKIELIQPIMDEINGIEMTEMKSINSISINDRPPTSQPCHFNYCSRYVLGRFGLK